MSAEIANQYNQDRHEDDGWLPLTPVFQAPEFEHHDDFEYFYLTGHKRTDGSWKSSETLRTEYVRLTDDLVHKMVDGLEVTDPVTNETVKRPVDYVVWLDKSARPLSWLTRDLWDTLAADKDGTVPKQPESRFVNIDREQWARQFDVQGNGISDINNLDQSVIRSLRSIFLVNPNDRQGGLTEEIDHAPSQFDGKTVMIVDEVKTSGNTLNFAMSFFKRAFPDAAIGGAYWMEHTVQKNGAQANADLPVWYDKNSTLGRGVGERDITMNKRSKSTTQRVGAYFLSTALRQPDPKGARIRKELHALADDVRNRRMLVEPSRDRMNTKDDDYEDYDERVLRFNDVINPREFQDRRRQQDEGRK